MNNLEMLAAVGVFVEGMLAILFAIVWRDLRLRWALLLSLAYLALAASYGFMAAGYYAVGLTLPPSRPTSTLVACGATLITAGLLDFVRFEAVMARRLIRWSTAVAVLAVAAMLAQAVTRAVAFSIMAAYVLGWALLLLWARMRERRTGLGPVIVALLAFPVMIAAALLGYIRPELINTVTLVPFSALGMSLLCTGLLKAQRRVAQELAAREQAEAELRVSNELLEHRVKLRTADLHEVIEGLESFNRSVSHDLRGPLGGIAGLASLAQDSVVTGDPVTAAHWLQLIQGQAEKCVNLVAALLALARASDVKLHVQRVDLQVVVRDALESLRITRSAAQLPVSVAPLPEVDADPELARQVVVNLLGNALKFSADAPEPRVEVGVIGGSDRPTIFVRDNGAGFTAAEAQRLFRPFHRLHGDRYEGFGVGLSIVKRIMDRHGGRVWAQGEPGRGATFFFNFGRPSQAPERR